MYVLSNLSTYTVYLLVVIKGLITKGSVKLGSFGNKGELIRVLDAVNLSKTSQHVWRQVEAYVDTFNTKYFQ